MPKKKLLFSILLFWVILITILSLVSFRKMPKIGVENSDKYVHFTFYFVLTFLLFLNLILKNSFFKTLFFSITIAVIYGIIIEVIQETVTTSRRAELGDILFNSFGSLVAGLILFFFRKRLNFLK